MGVPRERAACRLRQIKATVPIGSASDVELFAAEQKARNFKDTTVSRASTVDGDHGRIETRDITVIHDIDWLQRSHQWPGLKSVVMVQSTREAGGRIVWHTERFLG